MSRGWTTDDDDDDGGLIIEWMCGPPAPDAILAMPSCKCISSCKLPDRTCLTNGLKCTDMCKLQTCTNQKTEDEGEMEVDVDDSDIDEEATE